MVLPLSFSRSSPFQLMRKVFRSEVDRLVVVFTRTYRSESGGVFRDVPVVIEAHPQILKRVMLEHRFVNH
jgi:hypothetical protein